MEEQSRIVELEEELGLRRAQIQDLQARLRGADLQPPAPDGQSQDGVSRQQAEESGVLGEELASSRQEVESLKMMVETKNQEISEMKQKIQQTSRENMEVMDTWKVPAFLF